MTDEEKKAIERLKDLISKSKVIGDIEINKQVVFKDIETILKLIEKQQKEIEELKTNKGYHIGFIDGGIAKRYEYEDKIIAKIEELEKDFKEYENGQEWEIQDEIRGQIDVLQSLLEKE